jgi:membrane associated rhomboid family serine protease
VYFFYYIPVGLDLEVRRRTTITYFISLVCVGMFFIYRYHPSFGSWNAWNLVFQPLAPNIGHAVTYTFLHGGYVHLIGNVVYLLLFGRVVEDRFGPGRFYLIFLLSTVVGAYTHLLFTTALSPQFLAYPVVGASGATSGLLGAYMTRCYFSRVRVAYWIFMPLQGVNRAGRAFVPVVFAVVLWLILQGVYAVIQLGSPGLQVAYSLHIGGFAAGIALALFFGARTAAKAENHVVRAKRYFAEADWFASQVEWGNYLDIVPDDPDAHAAIARAFVCSGDSGMARHHFREAIRAYLAEGVRNLAEGAFAEAMRHIPGFTMDADIHLDLAYRLERTLKFKTAAAAYDNFIKRYADSSESPFVLFRMAGILERRFQRPFEALSCYRDIVTRFPNCAWIDHAKYEIDRIEGLNISLEGGRGEAGANGVK